MPYVSAKQRRFMHWAHPGIARRWDNEYGGKIVPKVPQQRSASMSMQPVGKSLAELGEVSKASTEERRRHAGNAAIGTGAVLTGAGLAGGGIPGTKATRISQDFMTGPVRNRPANFVRARRAGLFGYRTNAHKTLLDFELTPRATDTDVQAALRHGKRAPEEKIIRHMRRGRAASYGLLAGGAGSLGYGLYERKRREEGIKKAKEDRDTALVAGGGLTAAGGLGLGAGLNQQGRKWSREAEASLRAAGDIDPRFGQYQTNKGRISIKYSKKRKPLNLGGHAVPDIAPTVRNRDITDAALKGKTREQIAEIARHRGAAGQQRYFANVYGTMGAGMKKIAAPAGLAAAGVGGYGMYRRKQEQERARR